MSGELLGVRIVKSREIHVHVAKFLYQVSALPWKSCKSPHHPHLGKLPFCKAELQTQKIILEEKKVANFC